MSDDNAVDRPTQPAGLIPVPSVKTYNTRDGNVSEKLTYDLSGWTQNQIRILLVGLCVAELDQQIALQNPPAFAEVDGVRGRGIAQAQRKIVVSFGNRLSMAALNMLKAALKQAISQSTRRITGKLSDMSNWQFRYVHNGKVTPLPVTGASGIPMGRNDFIVLMPVGVTGAKGQAYATAVNMRVSGAGKLSFRRSAIGKPAAKNQGIGFLALAARAAGTSPLFGGFNVLARFTTKHVLPTETVHHQGQGVGPFRTGYLKISPKIGK